MPVLLLGVAAAPAPAAKAADVTLYELPPATHAGQLAFARDGALWFVGSHGVRSPVGGGQFIGRRDAAGELTEFAIPQGRTLVGKAAVGPEGDYFVPGSQPVAGGAPAGRITRVSASGPSHEYTFDDRFATVPAVASVGEDLWYAADRVGKGGVRTTIGRIALSGGGVERRFHLPGHCEVGSMVAVGEEIWFGEACRRERRGRTVYGASISQIDAAGVIVRHRISPRFRPVELAAAADGSVWFAATTRQGRTRIGHLSPGGRLREFRIPGGDPGTLAVGPEGRLWFPSALGRGQVRALESISRGGDIGEPVCIAPGCALEPTGLTAAPDDSLWFSARGLRRSLGGGGGTGIAEDIRIADEWGTIGRLSP